MSSPYPDELRRFAGPDTDPGVTAKDAPHDPAALAEQQGSGTNPAGEPSPVPAEPVDDASGDQPRRADAHRCCGDGVTGGHCECGYAQASAASFGADAAGGDAPGG